MAYTLQWKETGLIREFSGLIDAVEALNANLELHKHKRFDDLNYIINDFTRVTEVTISADQTQAYATSDDMVSLTKGELKIALLVTDELRPLALAYQQQMIDSSFSCQIFATMADAEVWCLASE